jgi:hypothetical protein
LTTKTSTTRGRQVLLTATAWHEAGHALAAMREGCPIKRVLIHHDQPGSGLTQYQLDRPRQRFCPKTSHGNARAAWEEAVADHLSVLRVLIAGPLAEARKLGKPMRALGAWYDFEDTWWLAQSLMEVQVSLRKHGVYFVPNVPAIFNVESRRVRHWLARPVTWSAICRIAGELLDKGELGASDVLRCYLNARNEAQLPLGLDWAPESDDSEDCEHERRAA